MTEPQGLYQQGLIGPIQPSLGSLANQFGYPPFSILDGRQTNWKRRKKQWLRYGIKGEEGRDAEAYKIGTRKTWLGGEKRLGTSVFDPVLCELMYRWFCPPGGRILDPFAGGSTRGLVAAALGYKYVGIEIRPEQMHENAIQAERLGLFPQWILGDSANLDKIVHSTFDFVFTSPPYFGLEKYGGGKGDVSAFADYNAFIYWLRVIFHRCVNRLDDNKYLAVQVGEIRRSSGEYYGFVPGMVRILHLCGLQYYNEMILISPTGSLAIRVAKQFKHSRKIGKHHQNILVFRKGVPDHETST